MSICRVQQVGLCLLLAGAAAAAPAQLFVVNGSASSISEISANNGSVLNTFATPEATSGGPDGLALSGSSLFFVNGFGTNTIYTLSPTNGTVSNTFLAPEGAIDALGFGSSRFGDTLFALDFGASEILLLDPSDGSLLTNLAPGVDLVGGMDYSGPRGTLFVTDFGSNTIYEINPNNGKVLNSFASPTQPGASLGLGVDGGRLFVSDTVDSLIYEMNPDNGGVVNVFVSPDPLVSALAGGSLSNSLSDNSQFSAGTNVVGPAALQQTIGTGPRAVGGRLGGQLFGQLSGRGGDAGANYFGGPSVAAVDLKSKEEGQAAGDEGFELPPLGAWVSFSRTRVNNNLASTSYDSDLFTYLAGVDTVVGGETLVGIGFGYETSDTDTNFNGGDIDADTYTVMPYIGHLINDWLSFDALVGFTYSDIDLSRTLGTVQVTGDTDSTRWFTATNLNVLHQQGDWAFTGSVGALYASEDVDSFTETIGTGGRLRNPSRSFHLGQIRVGGGAAYFLGNWEPYASAYYVYDWNSSSVRVAAGQLQPSDDDDEAEIAFGIRYYDDDFPFVASVDFLTVQGREDIDANSLTAQFQMDF